MEHNYYGGYYKVGEEKFRSKTLAAIKATELKLPMTWHFHDDIFAKVKPTGQVDLKELYKQRALQLRDKYDYLILNFSGGSDSWTVLHTFLENNIKLDHVFVKWPKSAMDKGFYTPNTQDRSAFNFASEWDFTIKKDLEWLAQAHPEIKIEVGDWLENLNEKYFHDDLFHNTVNDNFMTNLLRGHYSSETEKLLVDKGLKVGSIYGVDKPWVVVNDNKCFFHFADGATATCPPQAINPYGTEYFYWSPDMPEVAVEQAYKVYQWYKTNADKRNFMLKVSRDPSLMEKSVKEYMKVFEESSDILRSLIYPDWDFSKFQAFKPLAIPGFDGKQKDIWLESRPEMVQMKQVWKHYWKSYTDKIDPKYMFANREFKKSTSRLHYLGDM
jgi:hypothetical protein